MIDYYEFTCPHCGCKDDYITSQVSGPMTYWEGLRLSTHGNADYDNFEGPDNADLDQTTVEYSCQNCGTVFLTAPLRDALEQLEEYLKSQNPNLNRGRISNLEA